MKSVYTEDDFDEEEPFGEQQPVRTSILRKGVGIIEMEYYEDDMVMYCPHCRAAGFQVKLGPKIIMPGEKKQPDYDKWLQCTDCYEVVATYVVEGDASVIKDDIPTVDNPYHNTTEIIGLPRRTTKAGQRAAAKRNRNRTKLDDDPQINEEIRRHGSDRVHVIQ